jgi:hypothetical protein
MCKSQVEGGQRCSSSTSTRFTKATQALEVAVTSGDTAQIGEARAAWDVAAVEHASTREGRNELRKEHAAHTRAGDQEAVAQVSNIIQRGHALARANRAAAEAIREANRPEARTARDIAQGSYTFVDNDTAVKGRPRFVCETHTKPGSCTTECAELLDAMTGDDGGVEYDPTGTSYGPEQPYALHAYDAKKKAVFEYVVTPIDALDDTSHTTVLAALANR